MHMNNISEIAKRLNVTQNVSIQVLDRKTGEIVQEVSGHNAATNSLLYGVAHHLIGDFMPNERHGLNPGYSMLSNYVPRYISLGTMGLLNQEQDEEGLPAGIGDTVPSSDDPEYLALKQAMDDAKETLDAAEAALEDECPYYPATTACESCQVCSDRIAQKKQDRDDAQDAYDAARLAFMTYNEEARFVGYMQHVPGYGADGYSKQENNGREWFGLGYAFTSYEVTSRYYIGENVTYKGYVYECSSDTPNPAGPFDESYWTKLPDADQPANGLTINLELISPTYPRMEIAYRDVVPEYASEQPKVIDVVYSAMISTGALQQFREEGKDYIFITEAGLWSKKTWEDGNENGLLAGYRIGPPNENNWDMTDPKNRKILKQNILKVGTNQVVQVIWKIQIGSINEFLKSTGGEDTPSYNDDVYYTVGSIYSNNLNRLLVEKIVSTDRNIPVSFIKSTEKRGCPVPQDIFRTDLSMDGPLYLDFTVDDDNTEIIYWWTTTGEVHYFDNYVNHMLDNMNVVKRELDGWYYMSTSVYLTAEGISELTDLVNEHNYTVFAPLFTEDQIPAGTDIPSNRTKSLRSEDDSTPLYYYDEHGLLQQYYYDLEEFISEHSDMVPTSDEEYILYVSDSEYGYYYCGATLEFLNNENFKSINDVVCFSHHTPSSDSDSESDTDTEGPVARDMTLLSYRGWNTQRLTSLSHAFDGCLYIHSIDLTDWNTYNITDMSFTFNNAEYVEFLIGVESWNTSHVTDMSYMFYGCGRYAGQIVFCGEDIQAGVYNILTLDNWDTNILTNMDYMFAHSRISIPYKNFDTSNVTSMVGTLSDVEYVQYDTSSHEDVTGAKLAWDTSKVTDMSHMFEDCIYGCKWDLSRLNTSSVTNMESMFKNVRGSVNYSTIINLDVHNVTNFGNMFESADGVVYTSPYLVGHEYEWIDVSNWITSSAIFMDRMFSRLTTYVTGVENFDTSNVTDFRYMFYYSYIQNPIEAQNPDAYGLVHIDLGDWDVSSGEYFDDMFCGTADDTLYDPKYLYTFDNIDQWDVTSNATNIAYMFSNTIFAFNSEQSISLDFSGWDLSNAYNYSFMFSGLHGTDGKGPILTEIQCTVTLPSTFIPTDDFGAYAIFGGANIQKLIWNNLVIPNNWKINLVTSMIGNNNRFLEIVATNWDLRGVTTVSGLFYSQYLRKINISGWEVSTVTNFSRMLSKFGTGTYPYYINFLDPGVLDYSSMNNWTINPDATFTNMCSGNLCDNEEIAQLDGYHAFEQPYNFPSWTGTWDTTNLQSTVVTATNFPYYYQQAGESYTAYYLGTEMTTGGTVDPTSMNARFINNPNKNTMFGTFTPSEPITEPVTLSSTGINQLRTATTPSRSSNQTKSGSENNTQFIALQTGYQVDTLVYKNPQTGSDVHLDITAEDFKERAQYLLDTTNPNIQMYYDGEFYWCDAQLQFTDTNNFSQIVNAIKSNEVSFENWSCANLTSIDNVFYGKNFKSLYLGLIDTENLTSMVNTFGGLNVGYFFGFEQLNTTNLTNLDYTFDGMSNPGYFTSDILDFWNTSSLTSMNYTFSNSCMPIPLYWDTSSVTSMEGVLSERHEDIEVFWDTSHVTNMSKMFYKTGNDDAFVSVYNINTSSSTNMSGMFSSGYYQLDISDLDVSHVTNMSNMFYEANFIDTDPDFSNWDVSNVKDMSYMFVVGSIGGLQNCTGIENWAVSNVEDFSGTFMNGYYNTHYAPSGVVNWNITNGSHFDEMFYRTTLTDINCDDLVDWFHPSGYFTCDSMFYAADLPSEYSQETGEYIFDISSWSFSNVQSARSMFDKASGPNTFIMTPSVYFIGSPGPESGAFRNFFRDIDVKKLVWNNVYVTYNDIFGLKEILDFDNTDEYDPDYDSPLFEEVVATGWTIGSQSSWRHIDLSNLFSHLHNMISINLSGWNVAGVNNFSEMFYKANSKKPGVLDFSSLDNWSNIDYTADFTRMCASNLQDDEIVAHHSGYHAFEQGFRFPNWPGGTWDTSDLQQVHIDQANYPYYYQRAGYKEYDAYCFGTEVKSGRTFLINKPPVNSTFGTFIPNPPTDWTYNWDLTTSLIDSEQSSPLRFVEYDNVTETTTPPAGEYVSGTGIVLNSSVSTRYDIRIPTNVLVPGTIVEIDFTNFTTGWGDTGGNFILSTESHSGSDHIDWSFDSEEHEWLLSPAYETDPELPMVTGFEFTGISGATVFANSTAKLECVETANHNLQWKVYKDDTLLYTSSELKNGVPFLPPKNLISGYKWSLSTSLLNDVIITGIRVFDPTENS